MLGHVRERLLDNSVHGRLELRIELHPAGFRVGEQLAGDLEPRLAPAVELRSRSASTLRFSATAFAADAANVRSNCSSSAVNGSRAGPRSNAASTPRPLPR